MCVSHPTLKTVPMAVKSCYSISPLFLFSFLYIDKLFLILSMITLVATRAWVLNFVLYLGKTIYNQQIVSSSIHHIELH